MVIEPEPEPEPEPGDPSRAVLVAVSLHSLHSGDRNGDGAEVTTVGTHGVNLRLVLFVGLPAGDKTRYKRVKTVATFGMIAELQARGIALARVAGGA